MEGLIFDIKHYAIHDGPGIRQTIFFKGCPLTCWWCHNPESQKNEIEYFTKERKLDGQTIKRKETIGYTIQPDELFRIIQKDTIFFDESGGGVTFSGGEPLMQHDFLKEVAGLCNGAHIHTALDTSGYAPQEVFLPLIPYFDLVLFDLKFIDDEIHQRYTGVSNENILKNLRILEESNAKYRIRFPLIPEITNTPDNLEAIKSFLSKLKRVDGIDILPYHDISKGKYNRFDKTNKMGNIQLTHQETDRVKNELSSSGLNVQLGG